MEPLLDSPPPYATIVFDCDSTLSSIEGIDELAATRTVDVRSLTERAMRGEIALEAVYGYRLALVRPTRAAVEALGGQYVSHAMPHARELVLALRSLEKRVSVVSGGLEPAVRTLARAAGVDDEDVFAVAVRHDARGEYAGYDEASPLARSGGKIEIARALAELGPLAFVGDGITDLETATVAGAAARFVAFGGVVRRDEVFARARASTAVPDLAALLPLLLSPSELDQLRRSPRHAPLLAACKSMRR